MSGSAHFRNLLLCDCNAETLDAAAVVMVDAPPPIHNGRASWEATEFAALGAIFEVVVAGTAGNIEYYKDKQTLSRRFQVAYAAIARNLNELEPRCLELSRVAPSFDISPHCRLALTVGHGDSLPRADGLCAAATTDIAPS